jgi:hypothetical protein
MRPETKLNMWRIGSWYRGITCSPSSPQTEHKVGHLWVMVLLAKVEGTYIAAVGGGRG